MDLLVSSLEPLLFIGALLVLASIVANRLTARLGVPALLVFLLIGMLAGSEGPGGIYFNDPALARSVGVVALTLILFSGGLDTDWRNVRNSLWQGLALSTFGVLITAVLVGILVARIAHVTPLAGFLIGSIVSSTDAAAVFAVLGSRNVRLKGDLKPLLEFESGSNDPMAVFLTVGMVGLILSPSNSILTLIPMFLLQMSLGALAGFVMGGISVYIINRLRLEYEGLYPVLTLTLVILCYSGTVLIGGNGFLAVYLCGIVMGNSDFIHKRSLTRFHDGLAWLMQIAMFLTLGLLVFPSRLIPVIGTGLLVAGFLMFVGRPISVFGCLAFTRRSLSEKTFISWVGLRGAVPIVLATFPLLAGLKQADMIFDLVFFIVLTSVLLQGPSIPIVAKWLKLDVPTVPVPEHPEEPQPEGCLLCRLSEARVSVSSAVADKQLVEAGIPDGVDILLLSRNGEISAPTGSTVLKPDDVLLVLAKPEPLEQLFRLLSSSEQNA